MKFLAFEQENIVHVAHELAVLANDAEVLHHSWHSLAEQGDDHWPQPEQSTHTSIRDSCIKIGGLQLHPCILIIDIQRIYYDTAVWAWSYWEKMALGSVGEGFAFLFQVKMPF